MSTPPPITKPSNTISIDKFDEVPRWVLSTVGIVVPRQQDSSKSLKTSFFFFIRLFLSVVICFVCQALYFIKSKSNGTAEFVASSNIFMCCIFLVWSFVSTVSILLNKNLLAMLIGELDKCFPKTKDEQERYQVSKYAKQSKLLTIFFISAQVTMIMCLSLIPFTYTIIVYLKESRWEVDFLYYHWYPFNAYQRGVFEICFMQQLWAGYFAVVMVMSLDILLCSYIIQVRMHLHQLKYLIQELDMPNNGNQMAEKSFIRQFVDRHNLIFEYVFSWLKCFKFIA